MFVFSQDFRSSFSGLLNLPDFFWKSFKINLFCPEVWTESFFSHVSQKINKHAALLLGISGVYIEGERKGEKLDRILTKFDVTFCKLIQCKESSILSRCCPFQSCKRDEDFVFGRENDQVSHLTAVCTNLLGHVIRSIVNGHRIKGATVVIKQLLLPLNQVL